GLRLRPGCAPVRKLILARLFRQPVVGDVHCLFEGHQAAPVSWAIAAGSMHHAHRAVTLTKSNALCHPDGNGAPTTGGVPGAPTPAEPIPCIRGPAAAAVEPPPAQKHPAPNPPGFTAPTVPVEMYPLTKTRSEKCAPAITLALAAKLAVVMMTRLPVSTPL